MNTLYHAKALLAGMLLIGLPGCFNFPDGSTGPGGGGYHGPDPNRAVSALDFDGRDDYVLVPNSRELQIHPQGSFTIDAWVKPDKWETWNWVAAHATSNENNDVLFGFDKGRLRFITCDLSNDLLGSTQLTTGQWHHVAGVQNVEEGTMKIYLDGRLEGTRRLSGTPETTTGDFFIGAREAFGTGRAVELFDGIIHELRIWKTPLSQEQIREVMHTRMEEDDVKNEEKEEGATVAGYDRRLIAHWPLNEGRGSDVFDRSGNDHHGRIHGNAAWVLVTDPIR